MAKKLLIKSLQSIEINFLGDYEIRDTDAHDVTAADADNAYYSSLRVQNNLDVNVTIYFRNDMNTSSTGYLKRSDGSYVSVSAPLKSVSIITPEELRELPYMRYIRPIVIADSAPSEGVFTMYAVMRK